VALAGVTALLGSCQSPSPSASPSAPRWMPPSAPASGAPLSPDPAGPTPSAAAPGEITLAFAGDVHFADRTLKLLGDPATAFGPITSTLSAADVAMVNLETAVTEGGVPEPKTFPFRSPASTYEAVRAAGVDVVTLANNHALDYGRQGLADTLAGARDSGVPAVGAGPDARTAYAPWITDVRGTKIAFLGFSQLDELWSSWRATASRPGIAMTRDLAPAREAVRAARKQADVVVVYVHWGREGADCPTGEMRTFAGEMAKAGADVVLGTHAHLLLGDGWLGKTYVQYGLGNFLWWRDDSFSNDTGVLRVVLRDGKVARTELVPALISRRTGQPEVVQGAEQTRIMAKYAKLRGCTRLASTPGS
jgi:poly-gamma-glutamate synthesis protein (capsule biosynthesis protein)